VAFPDQPTMFMPNVSCSWVSLYRLFSTTSGSSPSLSSNTTAHADCPTRRDIRDTLDLLVRDQLPHALEQRALVHLIRKLVHDDCGARAAVDILGVRLARIKTRPAPGG